MTYTGEMTTPSDFGVAEDLFSRSELVVGGDFELVDHFTTLFAQWSVKDSGDSVLVQLFPRAGAGDAYSEGYTKPNCGACSRPLTRKPSPVRPQGTLHCATCARRKEQARIVYVPGRLEKPVEGLSFPEGTADAVMDAADLVWAGDVQGPIYLDELQAFALKFQRAGSIAETLVDQFLRQLDSKLESMTSVNSPAG